MVFIGLFLIYEAVVFAQRHLLLVGIVIIFDSITLILIEHERRVMAVHHELV